MYRFVEQPDQAFVDSLGLTPDLFATHKANLIAILDVEVHPVFLKMYDLETQQPLAFPLTCRPSCNRTVPCCSTPPINLKSAA